MLKEAVTIEEEEVYVFLDQIKSLFEAIKPKRIEAVIRKINEKIDPIDEMEIPKNLDLSFIHVAVVSSEWESCVTPDLVEVAVDEMNKWIVEHTKSDALVGSFNFLNDESEELPQVLKKYDIPLDDIPYEYYRIP